MGLESSKFFAQSIIDFDRVSLNEQKHTLARWSGSPIVLIEILRALNHPIGSLEDSLHMEIVFSLVRFMINFFIFIPSDIFTK